MVEAEKLTAQEERIAAAIAKTEINGRGAVFPTTAECSEWHIKAARAAIAAYPEPSAPDALQG